MKTVVETSRLCLLLVVAMALSAPAFAGQGPQVTERTVAPAGSKSDSPIIPVGASPVRGPADAPVTIVIFTDFQCPFCSRANPTIKAIEDNYTTNVRVVFKHNPLPFHKDAPLAAEAAMAAHAQGKFWEMSDLLFQNQRALKRADLEAYAVRIGLDLRRFNAALNNGEHKKHIEEDKALAAKIGARGTPNFFINGIKIAGAAPLERFKDTIDAELGPSRGETYAQRVAKNYEKPKPRPSGQNAEDKTVYKVPVDASPVKGSKNALVTIVVFSEFQCPFCARVDPTLDSLFDAYRGKIRFSFKHFPLSFHKDAMLAAEASMAAHAQGKFWPMYKLLLQNQKDLKRPALELHARSLGLNMKRFSNALDTGKFKKHIEADMALAKKLGVRGTPHFFINGKRLKGAQTLSAFKKSVEDALQRAAPLTKKGLKGARLYKALMKDAVGQVVGVEGGVEKKKKAVDTTVYKIDVGASPTRGPANAPLTIVMFKDFQCPFCARSAATVEAIEAQHKGRLRVVFKNQPLPFHKNAEFAAIAALAAHRQGKFWEMYKVLLENYRALDRPSIEGYARGMGLDMKKFMTDLDDPKLSEQVQQDKELAARVGARGTPTFFINGRKLVGAQPAEKFNELIKEVEAK